MKFLVDAHLPAGVAGWLRSEGHDVLRTRDLPARNRTSDDAINELSLRDQRVVVTKDTDFFHALLLHGRQWKLLLIRTGNIGTRELKELFQRHLPAILDALEKNTLVELDRQAVRVVA